jgi:hypothetical protein
MRGKGCRILNFEFSEKIKKIKKEKEMKKIKNRGML